MTLKRMLTVPIRFSYANGDNIICFVFTVFAKSTDVCIGRSARNNEIAILGHDGFLRKCVR